jgi:hypothetical protein
MKHFYSSIFVILLMITGISSSFSQCYPTLLTTTEDIVVDCNDASIPTFDVVEFSNECCDFASSDQLTIGSGQMTSTCNLTTAFGPGADWSIWLPGVNDANVSWHFDTPGVLEQYADGHARITGHITSAADPSQGFDVFFILSNARNWADWSALGRSYKDDLNLAGNAFQDWTYYEMEAGFCFLQGTGSLEGSQLQLTHQPSNYYFGFQIGQAANNKNSANGISGWFYYNGYLNNEFIQGHGDLNANAACTDITDNCGSTAYTHYTSNTNACGYTAYASQTWSSIDSAAPIFDDYVSPLSVFCDDLASVAITATDNCSSVSITFSDVIIEEGCNGTIERTYTATDGCGNSTTTIQIIELFGNTELEFTVFPENITAQCGLWSDNTQPNIQFTDGCGGAVLTFEDEIIPGDCGNTYTLNRTYTITDECGESVSQVWTVVLVDNTPPQIFNIPSNATISCGDPVPGADVFALDNCDGLIPVSLTGSTENIGCGYIFTRTWTATDGCGNFVEASQTITVIDNTAPNFIEVPEDLELECGTTEIPLTYPVAEDACSDFTITFEDFTEETECATYITRVFTATDLCGNSADYTQNIIIADFTEPEVSFLPEDVSFECAVGEIPMPIATDNCGAVDISFFDELTGDCAGSFNRTYFISDVCGNTVTHTITVTLYDETPPTVVFFPEDITVECGTEYNMDGVTPIFTDNCDNLTVVQLEDDLLFGVCPGTYSIRRVWQVEDGCGNRIFPAWTVTFADNTPPTFNDVPADITIECGEDIDDQNVTAFDLCANDFIPVQFEETEVLLECGRQIIRTWVAIDYCGNEAVATQTITLEDTQGPVFTTFPEDITISCGDPMPEIVLPNGYDECQGEIEIFVTENTIPGSCVGESYVQRIFRSFDDCGNGAIYFQTITIVDTEAPEFINPQPFAQITCSNNQVPLINVQDECSSVDIFFEDSDPSPFCGATFERFYTAIDQCGNIATFTQTIELIDETPPTIFNTPVPELTIECGTPVPDVFLFALDNCSGVTPVGLGAFTEETECGYIFTRTWITSDDCGNTAEFTQVITAEDTTAPVLSSYPDNVTISCSLDLPAVPIILATDACGGNVPVDFQEEFVGISACPTVERTWCAEDCAGNQVCHTQTITFVNDFNVVFRVDPTMDANYNVKWQSDLEDFTTIQIYNIAGQLVKTLYTGQTIGGAMYNLPLDTSNMATGVYLVQAKGSQGVHTQRIVIR